MNSSSFYPSQDSLYIGYESRYNSISEELCEEDEENNRICVVGDARNDARLINILVNDYNFNVVHSEKGMEYRNNNEVIFVMNDFESPDFKYLNSCSKLILGPTIILSSRANNLPLPRVRKNRPIYCSAMNGMRFSLSGCSTQESRRAVDLIHFMNGSARKNYTPADTLIAKTASGEKYRTAVNLEQAVLTLEWIEECWKRRDDIHFTATDSELQFKYRIKCFQCLRLYFAGFADDDDFDELKQTTKEHGGIVVLKYESATHAVCAYDLSARPLTTSFTLIGDLPRELNSNIKHVSREWFWKSVHMEQCASEELYSASGAPSRPLQSKENVPSRKRMVGDSPSPDDILRPSRKNNSKASLENLENSNNSSALPEHMYSSDNLDYSSSPKKNDKRYQISVEMLETEENYIRMLHMLINLYKKPLESMFMKGEELLNKKEIAMIFSKIPAIIDVHTNIRNNLNAVIQNWHSESLIGKIWADGSADLMKVYPPYVNSYDESVKTVENCDQTRPKFHTFLKMAESNPECQKNGLKDMLIRPIQRIPSVLLLLQELLKKTDKTNADYKWVKHAVDYLKDVLEQTNESRRQTENYQRFIELCYEIEDLPADIMTSAREFIQSIDVVVLDAGGALQKLKGRTIALFLFNDIVVLAKSRFVSSTLMNSTLGSFGGSGTIKERGSTLGRQISFTNFRRQKERRPYKYIYHRFFSAFRTMELIRSHGVFVVKLRDEKADELCFFQLTNGTTVEAGIEFFENLIRRLVLTSNRDVALEELTVEQLQTQCNSRPEEYEAITKALSTASELTSTGVIRRPSQLRRAVSNVSLGISSGLHRFTSRSRLSNIGEFK